MTRRALPAPDDDIKPARPRPARAFFRDGVLIGLVAGFLAACGGTFDAILPPGIPVDEGWQSLPIGDLLSRDTMSLRALTFCRKAECGEDSVLGIVVAGGEEARLLEAALKNADALRELIDRPTPVAATPRAGKSNLPRAEVTVELASMGAWSGARIRIAGGLKHREAFCALFARRAGEKLEVVLAISNDRLSSEQLARSAID